MQILKQTFRQFLVAIVFSALSLITQAATLIGTVIGISDGDTIKVLDSTKKEHKIRLMGIDAINPKEYRATKR